VTLANGVIIAYCLAALCPTLDVANAAVPTLLAIMLFMSGFLIRVPNIPVYWRWLTKVNMLHYSWAGLMANQFEGQPGAQLGGQNILEYYDLLGKDKWVAWGCWRSVVCDCVLCCAAWLCGAVCGRHGSTCVCGCVHCTCRAPAACSVGVVGVEG
jgi:hypothetical protein